MLTKSDLARAVLLSILSVPISGCCDTCVKTQLPLPSEPGTSCALPSIARACPLQKDALPPVDAGSSGWGYNHPYLEGAGLETLYFNTDKDVGANNPFVSGDTLDVATDTCADQKGMKLTVKKCGPWIGGAQPCVVDVSGGAPGICAGVRRPIEDTMHNRGVMIVNGYWDGQGTWTAADHVVTVACNADMGWDQAPSADGAITGCIQTWRYEPDSQHPKLEACIRALRADYCGDGVAHTWGGTDFDLHDDSRFAMTSDNCNDTRAFEANWSASGASCVAHSRWDIDMSLLSASCAAKFVGANATAAAGCQPGANAVTPLFTRSTGHSCNGDGGAGVLYAVTDTDMTCPHP